MDELVIDGIEPFRRIEQFTYRDWLAGLAMQGILSGDYPEEPEEGDKWLCRANHQQLASRAYMIADAMIKEGKK